MTFCCSIGARSDVADIDAALLSGDEGINALARRTGAPKTTMLRHRSGCLGLGPKGAVEAPAASVDQGTDQGGPEGEPVTISAVAQRGPTDGPGSDLVQPLEEEAPRERNRTGARKLLSAETERKCVELRVKGKSYSDIEQELGIPDSTAFDAVDRVLLRTRGQADEKAELARAIEVARCDAIIASFWDRATDPSMATVDVPADTETGVRAYDGQDKAADRLLKAMERRAKLLGLDTPTPQAPAVQIILGHPLVAEVWKLIGEELERFPEAREAVAARLSALQDERSGVRKLGG